MATNHQLHYGSTKIAPNGSHDIGATSGAFSTHLLDFDWGQAPKTIHSQPRANIDGELRRGCWYPAREFYHVIGVRVERSVVTAAADVEAARDDAIEVLTEAAYGTGGLVKVKRTRVDLAGNTVERCLYAELTHIAAPKWSRTDWGEGLVGRYDNPDAVVACYWRAPHPWFSDEDDDNSSWLTFDTTLRSTTVTNDGPVAIPLGFRVKGTGSGITFTVYNDTSGAASQVIGSGVTLTGVTLDATDAIILDQYITDLQKFECYQDTTDLKNKLSAKPRVWLEPGDNTIKWQATAGTPSSATIQLFKRDWYLVP